MIHPAPPTGRAPIRAVDPPPFTRHGDWHQPPMPPVGVKASPIPPRCWGMPPHQSPIPVRFAPPSAWACPLGADRGQLILPGSSASWGGMVRPHRGQSPPPCRDRSYRACPRNGGDTRPPMPHPPWGRLGPGMPVIGGVFRSTHAGEWPTNPRAGLFHAVARHPGMGMGVAATPRDLDRVYRSGRHAGRIGGGYSCPIHPRPWRGRRFCCGSWQLFRPTPAVGLGAAPSPMARGANRAVGPVGHAPDPIPGVGMPRRMAALCLAQPPPSIERCTAGAWGGNTNIECVCVCVWACPPIPRCR